MFLAVGLIACAGCNGQAGPQAVPHPVSLLLPREIRVHSFTSAKTFDEAGNVHGIEVHVEALDAYGDPTKAFGDFRFELHQFRTHSADPKGDVVAVWPEPLMDPKANALHWWSVSRTYVFRLRLDRPLPTDRRFVLVAVFSSPYTERLFAQRVFSARQ